MKKDSCIDLINKYQFIDIKNEYNRLIDCAKTRQISSIITGEPKTLLNLIADLFDIAELNGIMFPTEFNIKFLYSENTAFGIYDSNSIKAISFEDFSEKIQDCSSIDDVGDIFNGIIYLNNPILQNITVNATTINNNIDKKLLLNYDFYILALSAVHFLSITERNFIRNSNIRNKTFVVYNLDKIHDDEIENVKKLIIPYTDNNSSVFYASLSKQNIESIFKAINNIENVEINRIERICDFLNPEIKKQISDVLTSNDLKLQSNTNIIANINKILSSLNEYQDKTIRYVSTNYIDSIKQNTISCLLNFYEQMNQNIKVGIDEEKNFNKLEKEIPNFIASCWSDFVDNTLNNCLEDNIFKIIPSVNSYVDDKIDFLLKDIVEQPEYEKIKQTIHNIIIEKMVDRQYLNQQQVTETSSKDTAIELRKILPKFLMALGGVVMISSSFIPGALLLAAGFQGDRNVSKEIRADLITQGKNLNFNYLKEVQNSLDIIISKIDTELSNLIKLGYKQISDILSNSLPQYNEKIEQIQTDIYQLKADLDNLDL